MSAYIWIIIPVIAILGSYILSYQKNNLRYRNKNSSSKILEEIKGTLDQSIKKIERLEKRIQNMEAIISSESWEDHQYDKQKNQFQKDKT